jgi:flagellar hook-basal body complex protein FliE
MTVGPIPSFGEPDVPQTDASLRVAASARRVTFADALNGALGAASSSLERAAQAEAAFVAGRGGLQEMVVERAQADVLLAVASSAASRGVQSLATLFNMQV